MKLFGKYGHSIDALVVMLKEMNDLFASLRCWPSYSERLENGDCEE